VTDYHESIHERRTRLALEIARQRGELTQAFRNLEQPIHYAEYGLRAFGFLRKNAWVFSVVPAAFSIGSTIMGLRKLKGTEPRLSRREMKRLEAKAPKGVLGHALKWSGHGWKLFKLYRRVRPFFL
jgi:hypothetical protein